MRKPIAAKAEPDITLYSEKSIPIAEIFSGLSEKQIKEICNLGQIEHYEHDATIGREGDKSSKLYIVEDGQVAIKSELGSGVFIPLTIVSKDAAFGWSALVPPYILTATMTAVTKTKVLAIDRNSLLSLMQSDPTMGLVVMQNIASIVASRFRRFEEEMIAYVKKKEQHK